MKKKNYAVSVPFILVLAFAIGIFVWQQMKPKNHSRKLTVWTQSSPYSADPLDCDAFVHHITLRPVLNTLVTQYRTGELAGTFAKKWTSSTDLKEWRFEIEPNFHFENGDPITPEIIVRSWRRMAFLQKQRKSISLPAKSTKV